MNELLLKELYDLRQEIRKENIYANGGMPIICTDDALKEMASTLPETQEAICAIKGLGDDFRQNYADRFLAIISASISKEQNIGQITAEEESKAKKTLRDLSRRLSNISSSNPMLCHTKISGYSTKCLDFEPFKITHDFLLGKQSIVLCDMIKSDEDAAIFEDLVDIQNIVRRAQRDIGQNELYIAYPYVKGNIRGMEFQIRAPMALFPVNVEKSKSKMILTMDRNRDIVINTSLITAYENVVDSFSDAIDIVIDSSSPDSLISDIISKYKGFGLEIEDTEYKVIPFREYNAGDFISDKEGLEISYTMVLGRFSNESNAIQRDYSLMTSAGSIPNTVSELIANIGMDDFYFETESMGDKGVKDLPENDVYYINPLNSAQELIVGSMDDDNTTMVIQGPPGTGKSQVITSIIGSAVLSGKTVLMMAEMRTALEVLRSRLGAISKYALIIDNSQDKQAFYAQLEELMEEHKLPDVKDTSAVSADIQSRIDLFTDIRNSIYSESEFGISPYQLYMRGKWMDTSDEGNLKEIQRVKGLIGKDMYSYKYDELLAARNDLTNSDLVKTCYAYFGKSGKTSGSVVKKGLSEFDIMDLKTDAEELINMNEEMSSAGLLAKGKLKIKYSEKKRAFVNKYLDSDKDFEETLKMISRPDFINVYRDSGVTDSAFDGLSQCKKDYAKAMYDVSCGNIDTAQIANKEVFEYMLYYHITTFDASTVKLRSTMDSYDSLTSEISRRMGEKMQMLRTNTEAKVGSSVEILRKGKSAVSIRSVMDSENRMNLNKFMSKNIDALLDSVKIWLMTPETVSELLPMKKGLFDYLVIDEASQLNVERSIPSIYRTKKLIISGDHKQLRPTAAIGSTSIKYTENFDDIEEDTDAVLEQESLLDLARVRYETYFLNFHYRSKYEELIAFSNAAYYKGKLHVSPNVRKPSSPPIEYINVHGIMEKKNGQSKGNRIEAEKVVSIIKDLVGQESHGSIGVITMNTTQRDLIYSVLDKECQKDQEFSKLIDEENRRVDGDENRSLFINSIDQVQGDERDTIIFSIGYAKDQEGKLVQRYGWINQAGGENRLNVAITRAKEKIYLVTSMEPNEFKADNTQNKGPKLMIQYLRYAKAVSNGDTEAVKSILAEVGGTPPVPEEHDKLALQKEIQDYLSANGIESDINVGVSGYNIDVAVKKDDGYVLGIELDSSLYTEFRSTRERDVHRSKYLESRGWKVCRFWVPNYWSNKNKEMERILSIAKASL